MNRRILELWAAVLLLAGGFGLGHFAFPQVVTPTCACSCPAPPVCPAAPMGVCSWPVIQDGNTMLLPGVSVGTTILYPKNGAGP